MHWRTPGKANSKWYSQRSTLPSHRTLTRPPVSSGEQSPINCGRNSPNSRPSWTRQKPTCWRSCHSPRPTGSRYTALTHWSVLTPRSNGGPMSWASSRTNRLYRVWQAHCCSSRTMSGSCSAATCPLKDSRPSPTISPLGCPPWSAERVQPSRKPRTHTPPSGARSEIIGEARRNSDPEYLRLLPTDELAQSQEMLVHGFAQRIQTAGHGLILLDAHCVLDIDTGMFDISTDVMRRLGPLGFIHLEDQVERILERRTRDFKKRPTRTVEQLHLYQERSRSVCRAFAAALGKPIREVRTGNSAEFLRAIQTPLNAGSPSPEAGFAN